MLPQAVKRPRKTQYEQVGNDAKRDEASNDADLLTVFWQSLCRDWRGCPPEQRAKHLVTVTIACRLTMDEPGCVVGSYQVLLRLNLLELLVDARSLMYRRSATPWHRAAATLPLSKNSTNFF